MRSRKQRSHTRLRRPLVEKPVSSSLTNLVKARNTVGQEVRSLGIFSSGSRGGCEAHSIVAGSQPVKKFEPCAIREAQKEAELNYKVN